MEQKIKDVQGRLTQEKIDGWLLFDFQKRNRLAVDFLQIPSSLHLTRRFFYWIPKNGTPIKIVHAVEAHVLDHLPGQKCVYFSWKTLEDHLKHILGSGLTVAMEFSPRNAIPYISYVDGGMLDLVRECGASVVSSGGFIQYYTCVWSDAQRESHLFAAELLDKTAGLAWQFLSERLKNGIKVTEYDMQQMIKDQIHQHGCISEGDPICAVNANISNPHYAPTEHCYNEIRKGDFVLIDLWCKKNEEQAVYADISRVAVADKEPTERQKQIFSLVRTAQRKATELVQERFGKSQKIYGCEVDLAARSVIENAGFGDFFFHRTGHNIHTQDHGPGTHMDSLETQDERPIIPGTCFSIEPGIYLPNEFGVRLEYDVFITKEKKVEISGGIQDSIVTLL